MAKTFQVIQNIKKAELNTLLAAVRTEPTFETHCLWRNFYLSSPYTLYDRDWRCSLIKAVWVRESWWMYSAAQSWWKHGFRLLGLHGYVFWRTGKYVLLKGWRCERIIIIIMCLSSVVLLLNQRRSPPLRLQVSDRSIFLIMCDVPTTADCTESSEVFLL